MTGSETTRITLPKDNWAELRDGADVLQGEREEIMRLRDKGLSPLEMGLTSTNLVLAWAITEWSFDLPLPADNPESLRKVTGPTYDALAKAGQEVTKAMFPDFAAAIAEKGSTNGSEPTPTTPSELSV